MEICDIAPISPACVTAGAAGAVMGSTADTILDSVGQTFARGAEAVLSAVFDAISTATTVDLGASYVTRNAAAMTSVALVIVVGLFVVQVVTAAIRQEPRGLSRAVVGAGVAVLGAAAAAGIVQSLLIAVDQICDGVARLAGTTIQDAARRLLDISLLTQLTPTNGGGSVLMIVFGLLFILGATLTLGTLLVRQALIVVAVVVAPLAFAGGTARITSGWVRRWIQVTLALILSKLAIVLVFVVAVGMVGNSTGMGALLSGLILLLLACLAPWACFKFLEFAGTTVAGEWHRATNGTTIATVNQGRITAQSMMRTVAPIVGGSGGASIAARSGGGSPGLAAGGPATSSTGAVGGAGASGGVPAQYSERLASAMTAAYGPQTASGATPDSEPAAPSAPTAQPRRLDGAPR